ncbi:MAG: 30S ribosome-binding factor RbfA [Candidatus Dasytiphilus stammeri]
MNKIIRLPKLAKAFKKEITIILQRKIKDPRLRCLISVNHIDLSPDAFYAKVFVTFLEIESDIEIGKKIQTLQNASGYIRILLAKAIELRIIPKLVFFHDTSAHNALYMYNLITKRLKNHSNE